MSLNSSNFCAYHFPVALTLCLIVVASLFLLWNNPTGSWWSMSVKTAQSWCRKFHHSRHFCTTEHRKGNHWINCFYPNFPSVFRLVIFLCRSLPCFTITPFPCRYPHLKFINICLPLSLFTSFLQFSALRPHFINYYLYFYITNCCKIVFKTLPLHCIFGTIRWIQALACL